MKVGDLVKRSGNESQTWRVLKIKSDSRALWIKIDKEELDDVWHESSYFEVINESR